LDSVRQFSTINRASRTDMTSIPLRHRQQVCSVKLCSRHTAQMFPACSASLKIPMTCYSPNRFRFISSPFAFGKANSGTGLRIAEPASLLAAIVSR
jgi:hypothetical protein